MPLYPAVSFPATAAAAPDGWPAGLAGAGIVAVRVADLRWPLRRPVREGERTALTAEGAGEIRTGEVVVFLKPVAVTPAVVRRDGRVQAGGHPADHARLGVIERRLDAMTGQPGVIGQVAARVIPRGKVKGTARRSMTMAAAIRAVLLMALMPEAGYGEILSALFGDLALVPWHVTTGGRGLAGSDRGALSGLLPVDFPGPPAAPAVRLSPQRALHVSYQLVSRWRRLPGPMSTGSGSCCRDSGSGSR